MKIEFDPAKSEKNVRERGLSFLKAADFDFVTAVRVEDKRRDYKETRIVAYGFIGVRLYVLCFKPIRGGVRIISLRKANKREIKKYEEATKTTH